MSRSFGGWAPYVPVAARRRKAEREMEEPVTSEPVSGFNSLLTGKLTGNFGVLSADGAWRAYKYNVNSDT
jgi:hypothetical protein